MVLWTPIKFFLGLMSNSLLYCVRHEDTTLWMNPEEPTYRILVVNTLNIPNAPLPLALLGEKKTPCTKLAMIYSKPNLVPNKSEFSSSPPDDHRILQRKLSQTAFYEKKLLSKINMIAVIPVP